MRRLMLRQAKRSNWSPLHWELFSAEPAPSPLVFFSERERWQGSVALMGLNPRIPQDSQRRQGLKASSESHALLSAEGEPSPLLWAAASIWMAPVIPTSWCSCHCVIPSPWVLGGSSDLLPMNRILQKWWDITSGIRFQNHWLPSCSSSLILSLRAFALGKAGC